MIERFLESKLAVDLTASVLKHFRTKRNNRLPQVLFEETLKSAGEMDIELAIFDMIDGELNVLLIPRKPDDKIWPGEPLHLPGTNIRGHETEEAALKRLLESEVKGNNLSEIRKGKTEPRLQTKRGMEKASIYWTYGSGDPVVGKYYPVYNLPENVIDHHVKLIQIATTQLLNW